MTRSRGVSALRGTLRLLAAAAVVASLLPFAARTFWVFDLFAHFRAQYAVTAAVLGVALAVFGELRWAAAVAAAAVVSAWPLRAYVDVPGSDLAPPSRGARISVVSVNVAKGRDDAAPALLALVARARPDVVLVVELTPQWLDRLAPLARDYPHSIVRPRDDPWGIGVFAKTPLTELGTVNVGSTAAVDVSIGTGADRLRLLGVHLRPPVSRASAVARNRQLAELARMASENTMPMAICGDFNITPYSPHFNGLLERAGLRDTRLGFGLEFTWPTYAPFLGVPIDHCLVSADVAVAEHRRLDAFGSDHYPLLVKLAPGTVQ